MILSRKNDSALVVLPTMQLQILINIGRINHIIFSPPFRLGALLSSFLMISFTSLSVTPLVTYLVIYDLSDRQLELNFVSVHWDS